MSRLASEAERRHPHRQYRLEWSEEDGGVRIMLYLGGECVGAASDDVWSSWRRAGERCDVLSDEASGDRDGSAVVCTPDGDWLRGDGGLDWVVIECSDTLLELEGDAMRTWLITMLQRLQRESTGPDARRHLLRELDGRQRKADLVAGFAAEHDLSDAGARSAAEWLKEVLGDGPLEVLKLKMAAEGAGHSWRTVERAKKDLGARSRFAEGGWRWQLDTRAKHPQESTGPDARRYLLRELANGRKRKADLVAGFAAEHDLSDAAARSALDRAAKALGVDRSRRDGWGLLSRMTP